MRKSFTLLFVALLACVGVAKADPVAELQGKTVKVGAAATSVTADQWYILNNVGRRAYVSQEDNNLKMREANSVVDGDIAVEKANYLFKITAAADGKYNIMSGNGKYFKLGSNTASVSDQAVNFEIGLIGQSTDNFYLFDADNKYAADGQEIGNAFVGWSASIPTSAGGNDSYKLLPVSFETVPLVNITYNYYIGEALYTETTKEIVKGADYPAADAVPGYVAVTGVPTGKVENEGSFNLQCSLKEDFPFSSTKYFGLTLRNGAKWLIGTEEGQALTTTGLSITNVADSDTYSWIVEGTWYDGFYFKNKETGKYLAAPAEMGNGAATILVDEKTESAKFNIDMRDSKYYIRQFGVANNCVSDFGGADNKSLKFWNSSSNYGDAGSQFAVVTTEPQALLDAFKNENAAIVGLVGGYNVTAEEINNLTLETIADFLTENEVITLAEGEIFTVKCVDTNRGYMVYSTVEGMGSTTQAYLAGTNRPEFHAPIDAEGIYMEWAIVTRDNKNYIYNVENKKYITSGTPVKFSETPCAVEFIALEGALWEVKFENAGFLSFSPGWGADCVRTEGGVDDGCKFYLEKTGFEVSPAEIIFPEWENDFVELTEFGQTIQFAVDFTPIDATQEVTWSTSNEEVLSINEDGLAEVVDYTPQGFEMINVIATLADGTKISLEVAVMVAPKVEEGGVKFVMLNTAYKELKAVGETFQLTATAVNGNGEPVESEIVWSSSAYEVYVSETGLVQVLMPYNGTVTITATASNGVTATCMLNVSAGAGATLYEIYLSRFMFPNEYAGDEPFKVGDTYQLKVTFDPENFEDQRLSWTSDDEDVVTVDENGLITAVGVGEALITATALADTWVTKSCTVTVVPNDGETGIDAVEADAKAVIYDLTGRRVEKMEKGIYIVNGKKVVIK